MMKTFLLGACLFLLSIYIKTSCGETKVFRSKRSLSGQSPKETFNMFIKEQGSHFKEKVTFDMAKKTVSYHVPAHRDLTEADFMVDFNLNITVTRIPGKGMCYVRLRSPDEPSMDLLRKSMNMVSTGKYKIRKVSSLVSSEWTPTGLADRSKLSKNVIEFCRVLPIYEMKKVEQDGVTVTKGVIRTKRQKRRPFPFCKDPDPELHHYDHLQNCPGANYVTSCSYSLKNCVYWITCPNGINSAKDGLCDYKHDLFNALCCDLDCP